MTDYRNPRLLVSTRVRMALADAPRTIADLADLVGDSRPRVGGIISRMLADGAACTLPGDPPRYAMAEDATVLVPLQQRIVDAVADGPLSVRALADALARDGGPRLYDSVIRNSANAAVNAGVLARRKTPDGVVFEAREPAAAVTPAWVHPIRKAAREGRRLPLQPRTWHWADDPTTRPTRGAA